MDKPELLQLGPYPAWDEEPLAETYDVHRLFDQADPQGYLAVRGGAIRAIATKGDLGASALLIASLPVLEMISIYGVGYDGIDLDLCRKRGIRVGNTPDVLTSDVADLCVGMIVALERGVIGADAWVRSSDWVARRPYPLQRSLRGRHAGILGLGRIGTAIARRLAAFDMTISYCARAARETPPDWTFVSNPVDLARRSDILVVALPATPETRHIVEQDVISALGPSGLIANISRAANVDEGALLDALESGALRAAALDVFEDEPSPNPRFLALPNVILQPHAGSGTVETRRAMGQMMRDNLAAHFAGQPLLAQVV